MSERAFEYFDHTADVGARIFGRTLEELFVHAAQAMFTLIARQKLREAPASAAMREVTARAADPELLLVGWLSELLTLAEIENSVAVRISIQRLDTGTVSAMVALAPFSGALFERGTPIKAVTYHGLKLFPTAAGWQAEVIFDV
ncbi:MAG: archease [Candidatus Omnitrophica bacterium]|nr:archease [Candidatus Omnitrophota bacterium]